MTLEEVFIKSAADALEEHKYANIASYVRGLGALTGLGGASRIGGLEALQAASGAARVGGLEAAQVAQAASKAPVRGALDAIQAAGGGGIGGLEAIQAANGPGRSGALAVLQAANGGGRPGALETIQAANSAGSLAAGDKNRLIRLGLTAAGGAGGYMMSDENASGGQKLVNTVAGAAAGRFAGKRINRARRKAVKATGAKPKADAKPKSDTLAGERKAPATEVPSADVSAPRPEGATR